MAAVLRPAPALTLPSAGSPGRPVLRVIPGGRSAQAMAPVYRRRRLVAALVVVTLLVLVGQAVAALAPVAAGWAGPSPARIDGPTMVVEAEPGDTLWTIARRARPSGDVRPAVDAMVAERGTTQVDVGDRVRVPAP